MPTIFYSCWREKSESKCKNIRYHFHLIAIHRGLVDEWIVWIARKSRKQNAEQWTTQHDLRYGWNVLFSVFRAFPSNSVNNVKMYESWEILFCLPLPKLGEKNVQSCLWFVRALMVDFLGLFYCWKFLERCLSPFSHLFFFCSQTSIFISQFFFSSLRFNHFSIRRHRLVNLRRSRNNIEKMENKTSQMRWEVENILLCFWLRLCHC